MADAIEANPAQSRDSCVATVPDDGTIDFATLAVGDEITLLCPPGMRYGAPARLMVEAQGQPLAWARVTSKEHDRAGGTLVAEVYEISDDIEDLEDDATAFNAFDVAIWDFGGPLTARQAFANLAGGTSPGQRIVVKEGVVTQVDIQADKQFPIGSSVDLFFPNRRTLAALARVIYYQDELLRWKIEKAADIVGNSPNEVIEVEIVNPGSGYQYGDTITLSNGTVLTNVSQTDPLDTVTDVEITTPGDWASLPSNPVSQVSSSGSGSGATFNITTAIEQDEVLIELIDRAPPGIPLEGIVGLKISVSGTTLTIEPGSVRDGTDQINLDLAATLTKDLTAPFAAGDGNGCQVLSANLAGTIAGDGVGGTGTAFKTDFSDGNALGHASATITYDTGRCSVVTSVVTDTSITQPDGALTGAPPHTYKRGGWPTNNYDVTGLGLVEFDVILCRSDVTGALDVQTSIRVAGGDSRDRQSAYTVERVIGSIEYDGGVIVAIHQPLRDVDVENVTCVNLIFTTGAGGDLELSGSLSVGGITIDGVAASIVGTDLIGTAGLDLTTSGFSTLLVGTSSVDGIIGLANNTGSQKNITLTADVTLPQATVTRASLGLDTSDSPQFAAVNIGHASDTTISRTGAGDIAVEGNGIYRAGGTDVAIADGGTGASTATAGFDALSPLTTRGDILTRDASNNVRVALGASGTIVSSDGTDTKFQTPLTLGLPVLLASGSFSGAANLDMVLTGYTGYKKLVIEIINDIPASDNVNLQMRVSTDGGGTYDSGATAYKYSATVTDDGGADNGLANSAGTTQIALTGAGTTSNGVGNGSSEGVSVTIELAGQTNTAIKPRVRWNADFYSANDHPVRVSGTGLRNAAQDTDAVRFMMSGGGNHAGDYRIWGWK